MTAAGSTRVLALNAGSSSLKFGVFEVGDTTCRPILSGQSERGGAVVARGADDRAISGAIATGNADDAMTAIVDMLSAQSIRAPDVVGHRIVHGGPSVRAHARVDDRVLAQLHAAAALGYPDVAWPVQYRQGKAQLERNLARAAALAGEHPEANG